MLPQLHWPALVATMIVRCVVFWSPRKQRRTQTKRIQAQCLSFPCSPISSKYHFLILWNFWHVELCHVRINNLLKILIIYSIEFYICDIFSCVRSKQHYHEARRVAGVGMVGGGGTGWGCGSSGYFKNQCMKYFLIYRRKCKIENITLIFFHIPSHIHSSITHILISPYH